MRQTNLCDDGVELVVEALLRKLNFARVEGSDTRDLKPPVKIREERKVEKGLRTIQTRLQMDRRTSGRKDKSHTHAK